MAAEKGAKRDKVTEAVAVFHDVSSLDAAVEDLRKAGFKRSAISLLASEDAVEKKLGHRYERIEELEDAPDAPRVTYRTRASLGDTEDVIVGSLTYLPAVLAAGTVVASAGSWWRCTSAPECSSRIRRAVSSCSLSWVRTHNRSPPCSSCSLRCLA